MRILYYCQNLVFFAPEFQSSIQRSKVSSRDIVVVRRGAYTGECAVIPEKFDGVFVGYDLICVPSETTNSYWFSAAFSHPSIWQQIENIRKRAAQQGLNKEQILSFKLPYPPKPIQDKFAEQLLLIYDFYDQTNKVEEKLEKTFSVLLHRAFSGELTARWREAHLKELLEEMEIQRRELDSSDTRAAKLF